MYGKNSTNAYFYHKISKIRRICCVSVLNLKSITILCCCNGLQWKKLTKIFFKKIRSDAWVTLNRVAYGKQKTFFRFRVVLFTFVTDFLKVTFFFRRVKNGTHLCLKSTPCWWYSFVLLLRWLSIFPRALSKLQLLCLLLNIVISQFNSSFLFNVDSNPQTDYKTKGCDETSIYLINECHFFRQPTSPTLVPHPNFQLIQQEYLKTETYHFNFKPLVTSIRLIHF